MSEFGFTLRLDASELSDAQVMDLYNALPDSTISTRDGQAFIEVDREAGSFAEAVVTAIADIERLGLRVTEIEPDR